MCFSRRDNGCDQIGQPNCGTDVLAALLATGLGPKVIPCGGTAEGAFGIKPGTDDVYC